MKQDFYLKSRPNFCVSRWLNVTFHILSTSFISFIQCFSHLHPLSELLTPWNNFGCFLLQNKRERIAFVKCLSLMIDLLFRQAGKSEFDTLLLIKREIRQFPRASKIQNCSFRREFSSTEASVCLIGKSHEQTESFLSAASSKSRFLVGWTRKTELRC